MIAQLQRLAPIVYTLRRGITPLIGCARSEIRRLENINQDTLPSCWYLAERIAAHPGRSSPAVLSHSAEELALCLATGQAHHTRPLPMLIRHGTAPVCEQSDPKTKKSLLGRGVRSGTSLSLLDLFWDQSNYDQNYAPATLHTLAIQSSQPPCCSPSNLPTSSCLSASSCGPSPASRLPTSSPLPPTPPSSSCRLRSYT